MSVRRHGDVTSTQVITARPIRTGRIANACAVFVFAAFVVIALVMRRDNAGAYFGHTDQIFTVVIGVLAAAGCHLPARPRMRANLDGVHMRGYVGNWRFIPWATVVAVEFPSSVRFARLRLPGEETLAVYAVQRMDGDTAVKAMRGLRALFAATHPDAVQREGGQPADTRPDAG